VPWIGPTFGEPRAHRQPLRRGGREGHGAFLPFVTLPKPHCRVFEPRAADVAPVRESRTNLRTLLDNYGTHKSPTIQRWLAKRPRFILHFTPTSASWMNLVERFFATLTEKQIRRGTFRSTRQLETAIKNYFSSTTRIRVLSSGTKRPTRSSNLSADVFSEVRTHDTRMAEIRSRRSSGGMGRTVVPSPP
jgi:transposase